MQSAVDGGGEWRTQMPADARQNIFRKIMDSLKRHIPYAGQEGLQELKQIAVRFEEKIYIAATSQDDYLRRISSKLLTIETKTPMSNAMPSNSVNIGQNPLDPGSQSMQSQSNSQGQPIPVPVPTNLSQSSQHLHQNFANNIASAGMQGSDGSSSSQPPISSLSQTNIPNNQNSNTQSIPNISGVLQNSVASAIGEGLPSNIFADSQRQSGRQQVVAEQQQQQLHNSPQSLYKQQLLKQKIQSGAISHSQMQSHIQKQEQQKNLLQSHQLHSSQQSVMQPSMMQSSSLSNLQNQQSSAQQSTQSGVQQHPQSVRQLQASNIYQQQKAFQQQGILPTQQQHLVGQSNATNIQQNQLIGNQSSMPDMQQQQKGLPSQQNDLSKQPPQQLMGSPNNLAHMHQQQLGSQEQQHHHQLIGAQSGTSIMPNNRNSVHILQHSKVTLQPSQQSMSNLLPSQGQQSQKQSQQQMMSNLLSNGPNQTQKQQQSHMMSQMQSQPVQLQQKLVMQQHPNPLHSDMQQRLQILQQQKQVFQPQRAMPKALLTQTGNANGGDWQEEIYQKIKSMKDMYFLDLNDLYQKVAVILHQPQLQQRKNPQHEKLKNFKSMLERFISLLQVSKSNVQIGYKDKLGSYEKQIMSILNSNRPRKPIPPMQREQSLAPPHMHYMQQSQGPQSQITQLQPNENQMNFQMQSQNLQGYSVPSPSTPAILSPVPSPSTPAIPSPVPSPSTPAFPSPVPSPSTPAIPSPVPGESVNVNSGVSSLPKAGNIGHQTAGALVPAQSLAIGTPGISASPLLDEFASPEAHHAIPATIVSGNSNAIEQPLERLIKVVKSMSSKALTASVSDIGSVVSMIDRMAGGPGNGSSTAVGEDFAEITKCRLQARNFITEVGTTGTKKTKRYTTVMPSDVVSPPGSINDSLKQLTGSDLGDLDSNATSTAKKPRIEVNHALLEEIKELNHLLIDTVVNISDEDAAKEGGEGTVVKCSFCTVALSPNLKSQYLSSQMSQIQPLALLVPKNYPNCSPTILLDKFPVEVCKDYEDLSLKVRSRFSISLRSLSQPMSIGYIVKMWDICARDVISEYALQSGGGSFSSKYGTWENCLTAA